jgi:hypothetical protein
VSRCCSTIFVGGDKVHPIFAISYEFHVFFGFSRKIDMDKKFLVFRFAYVYQVSKRSVRKWKNFQKRETVPLNVSNINERHQSEMIDKNKWDLSLFYRTSSRPMVINSSSHIVVLLWLNKISAWQVGEHHKVWGNAWINWEN